MKWVIVPLSPAAVACGTSEKKIAWIGHSRRRILARLVVINGEPVILEQTVRTVVAKEVP